MQHHAYLYCNPALTLDDVPEALTCEGADVAHVRAEVLGIDEARRVRLLAYQRPLNAPRRAFVITARTLTHQAQNALLKIFEEPPQTAEFHLVVPDEHVLLPTLRSRLLRVGGSSTQTTVEEAWKEFKTAPLAARLAAIAERMKAKDTAWAEAIVAGAAFDQAVPRKVVATVATYLGHTGASKKMLLEHLALATPVGSGRP